MNPVAPVTSTLFMSTSIHEKDTLQYWFMRTLEQVLRWIVIIGAYLLPFVVFYVASNMFFPFITGKNFYFRIVVEIMAAAWLALALILPQYRPRRSLILAAFASFIFI